MRKQRDYKAEARRRAERQDLQKSTVALIERDELLAENGIKIPVANPQPEPATVVIKEPDKRVLAYLALSEAVRRVMPTRLFNSTVCWVDGFTYSVYSDSRSITVDVELDKYTQVGASTCLNQRQADRYHFSERIRELELVRNPSQDIVSKIAWFKSKVADTDTEIEELHVKLAARDRRRYTFPRDLKELSVSLEELELATV